MPELPEVETVRRDLNQVLPGLEITDVKVSKAKMVRPHSIKSFCQAIKGQQIQRVDRRGKLLMIRFKDHDDVLLIHLKMTGQLIFQSAQDVIAGGHPWPPIDREVKTAQGKIEKIVDLPNKYSHVIFHFGDKQNLYFNDQRQFGYARVVSPDELEEVLSHFGIEPLTQGFSKEKFKAIFSRKSCTLKALLLNQKWVAGIGNIYADEICFHAGIVPSRRINQLDNQDIDHLFKSTNHIIRSAVKLRGTTFNDFRDARGFRGNFSQKLKVYGRSGEDCHRCDGTIEKENMNGRGTHFCLGCQV